MTRPTSPADGAAPRDIERVLHQILRPVVAGRTLARTPRDERALREAVAGRRVLITGASRGIGRALAIRLTRHGATVMAIARDGERLAELGAEVRAAGGIAHMYTCDLADPEATAAVTDAILDEHGGIEILVNNAGRSIRRPIAESYERSHDAERTMAVNYFAAMRLILRVLPGMLRRRDGHILNVSSIGLQTHMPRFSAYNASKSALDAFSRSLAAEVAPHVRVTTVYMPLVRTAMSAPAEGFRKLPALTAAEAAGVIARAMITRPRRTTSPLGLAGEVSFALCPRFIERLMAVTDPVLG